MYTRVTFIHERRYVLWSPLEVVVDLVRDLLVDLVVDLVRDLVGRNIILRHAATNDSDTNVHMDTPHSPQYKTWYPCEVQAALCRAIRER